MMFSSPSKCKHQEPLLNMALLSALPAIMSCPSSSSSVPLSSLGMATKNEPQQDASNNKRRERLDADDDDNDNDSPDVLTTPVPKRQRMTPRSPPPPPKRPSIHIVRNPHCHCQHNSNPFLPELPGSFPNRATQDQEDDKENIPSSSSRVAVRIRAPLTPLFGKDCNTVSPLDEWQQNNSLRLAAQSLIRTVPTLPKARLQPRPRSNYY